MTGRNGENMRIAILFAALCLNIKSVPQETQFVQSTIQERNEINLTNDEYYLLAKCVEAEAGNQDLKGKRLVVDVILNRVDSERFDDDVISVISAKNQFSSYTDGGIAKATPSLETRLAISMETTAREDTDVLYFTAGGYNAYCVPAYKHGDHYFGY